jgi:hypothetical protein
MRRAVWPRINATCSGSLRPRTWLTGAQTRARAALPAAVLPQGPARWRGTLPAGAKAVLGVRSCFMRRHSSRGRLARPKRAAHPSAALLLVANCAPGRRFCAERCICVWVPALREPGSAEHRGDAIRRSASATAHAMHERAGATRRCRSPSVALPRLAPRRRLRADVSSRPRGRAGCAARQAKARSAVRPTCTCICSARCCTRRLCLLMLLP